MTLPKRLGPWRPLGRLGGGAQGAVFRAAHEGDGRAAALKVVVLDDERRAARFRREAQVLARLAHPNLVRALDEGVAGRLGWLALELVEGEPLDARLAREGPLPVDLVARVGVALGRALAAVHAGGCVHRDVKPANVVLARDGRVVLVDLGVVGYDAAGLGVEAVSRLSQTGELVGTPAYLAPEQVTAGARVGPPADVHALGATLFTLLTGAPPFEAASLVELCVGIATRQPPALRQARPDAPAWLAELVAACLAKDPAARPSATAVAVALARPAADRAPRHAASRAWAPTLVAATALALAAGAGAAVAWRADPGARPPGPGSAGQPTEPAAPEDPGWRVSWSLAGGAPARLLAPALWLDARTAAPLERIAAHDREAAEAGLRGRVERFPDGLSHRPDLALAAGTFACPGLLEGRAPRGAPLLRGHGPARLEALAPNDASDVLLLPGPARWRAPLRVRARVRRVTPVDLEGFIIGLRPAAGGPERVALQLQGRQAVLRFQADAPGSRGASAPARWPADDASLDLELSLAEDGEAAVRAGDVAARGAAALPLGSYALDVTLIEMHASIDELVVSGRLARTDRPAAAEAPVPAGATARVSAEVALEPDLAHDGGPFVGLATPDADPDAGAAVALSHGRLELRLGRRVLDDVPLPPDLTAAGRVRLVLLRRGALLEGEATAGAASARVEGLAPDLGPEAPLRARWGSWGVRARFEAVELAAPPAPDVDGPPAAWRAAWRAGVADVDAALHPDLRDAAAITRASRGDARARCAEAAAALEVVALAAAADPAPDGPAAARHALVRAGLAWTLAGDAAGAARVAARLLAGDLPAANAALARAAAVAPDWDHALARLAGGFWATGPGQRDAGLALVEPLAPALRGEVVMARIDSLRAVLRVDDSGVVPPRAEVERLVTLMDEANRAGVAPARTAAMRAQALCLLGRRAEGLALYRTSLAADPSQWFLWMQWARFAEEAGRGEEALEAALGGVSTAPARPALWAAALRLAQAQGAGGLQAAAYDALSRCVDEQEARVKLAEQAKAVAAHHLEDEGRGGRLAAWVLADRDLEGGAFLALRDDAVGLTPLEVLVGARLGDEGACARLAAAAREDPLVGTLARLHPRLARHVP